MKQLLVIIAICCGVVFASAQKLVEYRINTNYGFTDPDGNKNVVVEFPGKSAHQIYTALAINIGLMYNKPNDVMYGVEDELITVSGYSNEFCKAGGNTWSARYSIIFRIKDGKVLVHNPSIYSLTSNGYPITNRKTLDFKDLIRQYWYDDNTGKFLVDQSKNMEACEARIMDIVNMILGVFPSGEIPSEW